MGDAGSYQLPDEGKSRRETGWYLGIRVWDSCRVRGYDPDTSGGMMDDIAKTATLGYHRDMCAALFGADSRATAFLDEKIKTAPHGRDELVLADESQVVMLCIALNETGTVNGRGADLYREIKWHG